MTKYVYAEQFKFMLGENQNDEVKLPYQDIKRVMDSIQFLPIYIISYPLTKHPYLEENCKVKSSRIKNMEAKDGFCEVTTYSGTIYRLITE